MRRIRIAFPADMACNTQLSHRDEQIIARAQHIQDRIVAEDVYSDLRRDGTERRADADYSRWHSMAGER